MTLQTLTLSNFRNLQAANLRFSPKVNLIIGPNGSGKSSLLEAIHMLSLGRSFRARTAQSIISHTQPRCVVSAQLNSDDVLAFERTQEGGATLCINGARVSSYAQPAEMLPIQFMDPSAVQLLLGGPSERRRFLDWGVF